MCVASRCLCPACDAGERKATKRAARAKAAHAWSAREILRYHARYVGGRTMKLSGAVTLALVLCAGTAHAQSLKQQIVGTWEFVVAEIVGADGKTSFPFGETPKGILIFTPEGRFAQKSTRRVTCRR